MSKGTAYIYDKLTVKEAQRISRASPNAVMINLDESNNINLNSSSMDLAFLDAKGAWVGWEKLCKVFVQMSSPPSPYNLDLKYSLKKSLLNSHYRKIGIISVYQKFLEAQGFHVKVIQAKTRKWHHYLRTILSITIKLAQLLSYSFRSSIPVDEKYQKRILVPIEATEQFYFWEEVLREFDPTSIVFLIDSGNISTGVTHEIIKTLELNGYQYIARQLDHYKHRLPIRRMFELLKGVLVLDGIGEVSTDDVKILLLKYLKYCYKWYGIFEQLKPRVVLVNAFEVNNMSHLFCQIAQKNGSKVINAMNGLKTSDPRNSEANFDIWCVWNKAQKTLLIQENQISEDQLQITGHLQADKIVRHELKSNLHNEIKTKFGKRKIVSVFSQPQVYSGAYRMKFFDSIAKYFQSNQNTIAVVKPHPTENAQELKEIFEGYQNIVVLDQVYSNKTALYDLLTLSQVAVVMYSTVAVEAVLFQRPVISLDFTGIQDLLPIVDNKTVFKCTNYHFFKSKLDELLSTQVKFSLDDIAQNAGFIDGKNYLRVAKLIKSEFTKKDQIPL